MPGWREAVVTWPSIKALEDAMHTTARQDGTPLTTHLPDGGMDTGRDKPMFPKCRGSRAIGTHFYES